MSRRVFFGEGFVRTTISIALLLCCTSLCRAQKQNESDLVPPTVPYHTTDPMRTVNACAALNGIELSAALRAHDGIASMHNESPEKKVSSCFVKPIPANEVHDVAGLRATPGPEIVLFVSDSGGPPLTDPKTAASETIIPNLGDRATIVAGPMSNEPSARKAFRVWVATSSRSYSLIYSPDIMNQDSRDLAVQLAREVLMGDFKGQLDSYPIAEQLIAKDKIIANEKPDDFALWNEVGLLSQYLKRYDAAREAYLKISELLPNDFGGFLGIAAADLGRADSEKSDLINNRGISPTEDIALNPQNKDVCDTLKEKTRAIFEEGYANAKRAIQLQPNDGFSYRVLSLIAHHKSWIECGDPVTAKADNDEGDQLAKLSEEKSEAAMMRRDSNLRKVVVALGPPGPMGAIGGVIGNIISQNLVSPRPVVGDPGSVAVASGIQSGLLISKVNPIYPPLAREARIQGLVLLAAQISKKGEVESLQLISGHPMLAPAAIDAVKQWKYRPYLRNGSPVKVRTVIQVNFALSRQ